MAAVALLQPVGAAVIALDGILIGAEETRFIRGSMVFAALGVYAPICLLSLELDWASRGQVEQPPGRAARADDRAVVVEQDERDGSLLEDVLVEALLGRGAHGEGGFLVIGRRGEVHGQRARDRSAGGSSA